MTEITASTQVDKWVQQYIQLRDEVKRRNDIHEASIKELKDLMADRAGKLQTFLDTSGVSSASTQHGTVYTTTRTTASLADPKAFMDYVINNKDWEMLDLRCNSTAAQDYVKEYHTQPPGVNLTSLSTVGVRRPTKAKT